MYFQPQNSKAFIAVFAGAELFRGARDLGN